MSAALWWRLTRDLPLDAIFSTIDCEVQKRKTVEAVLRVLDNSKWAIFDRLLKHLESTVVCKALTLKIQNLCLARYHSLSQSLNQLSRPFGLVVDPADGCNLACPECMHSHHAKELKLLVCDNMTLPEVRLTALLKCYGPYAIQTTFYNTFYNSGGPLLNPDTPKFIRLAKNYLMRTTLSTNLSLDHFDAEAYVKSGLDFLVVSIGGERELVDRNIRSLVEVKRRLGKRTPVIACDKPAIDKDNEGAVNGNWNPFPTSLDASAIEHEFDARWVSQVQGTRKRGVRTAPSTSTCQRLYKNFVMDGGGSTVPCCGPRPDIDFLSRAWTVMPRHDRLDVARAGP